VNRWDLIIVALCALAVGASWRLLGGPGGVPHTALITTRAGERIELALARDTTRTLPGRHGPTTVEVLAGRARISDSACPQKLCVRAGWLSAAGESAACLPNGVVLRLVGDGDEAYDALSL
jgi:hypothetical protein